MRPDDASLKMAYEAERDRFWKFYRHVMMAMPGLRVELYSRGYRRGFDDALRFDHIPEPDGPPELDCELDRYWKHAFEDGNVIGREHRQLILRRVQGNTSISL
jgi:hypothetical protein